jgi:hypothetical protein
MLIQKCPRAILLREGGSRDRRQHLQKVFRLLRLAGRQHFDQHRPLLRFGRMSLARLKNTFSPLSIVPTCQAVGQFECCPARNTFRTSNRVTLGVGGMSGGGEPLAAAVNHFGVRERERHVRARCPRMCAARRRSSWYASPGPFRKP